ncbi:MAG: UvrD-helicase domain-containing protein [Bacteroidetes bacterium]|nr:UvrD-helicase domain-containing protein [Bacteroidota bacterium]
MKNITFINAGAGSGKTYSLTDELYRSISNNICRGDEVLLTTFTKRAAEEIRQRAHAKLLEKGKTEDAIALQNAYIGTVHSVGYRLITKFCYLVGLSPNIKELSGEDTDFYFSQAISAIPTVDDLDKLALLSERFQFQSMGDNDHAEFDPQKWKAHVQTIISEARRNRIDDLSGTGVSAARSREFIGSVFGNELTPALDFNRVESDLEEVFAFLAQLPDAANTGRKKKGQELKTSLNSRKISYAALIDIHEIASDILNKKDEANVHAASLIRATDSFFHSKTFRDDMIAYTDLVFKIARECITAFTGYKREHGLVDFTDMETFFLELLNLPEVQDELKHSIKLVMVDEFQDSNPVQLAIFLKLAEFVDQSIWVGDPKQAIYGFNGSDPVLVSELLNVFYKQNEQQLKLRLLKNSWRSRDDLVSLSNRIFEECLADQSSPVVIHRDDILGEEHSLRQWIQEKFGSSDRITLPARDTIGLISTRIDREQGFTGETSHLALKHWHFRNNYKGSGKVEHFNYYLARRIRELVSSGLPVFDKSTQETRALLPSDIAVLCRLNKDVKSIAAELISNGLEVAAAIDGLSATAEYRLLINILNYIADPSNSLAVSEILLLINENNAITAETLIEKRLDFLSEAPARSSDAKEYYEYIAGWGKDHVFIRKMDGFVANSRHLSVPELIEKMVAELELTRHISAWGHAEQRKANIQQLISYAHAYDDYCVKLNLASSLAGFVQWQQSDREKNNQAASGNLNAVNVLTYHKAKGLEWPCVILSGLAYNCESKSMQKDFFNTSVRRSAALDIELPLQNRYINFSFWPFGAKESIMGFEETIRASDDYQEVRRRKIDETRRLLYVGMTRARDYLVTTSFKEKEARWFNLVNDQGGNWSMEGMTKAIPGNAVTDFFGHNIKVDYQVIVDEGVEFTGGYEPQVYKPGGYFEKEGAHSQDDPKFISPSRLEGSKDAKAALVHDFNHRIRTGNIENEAVLGNCLHDILYLWPESPGVSKIESMIARHGLAGQADAADVSKALGQLKNYFGALNPVNIYRELPLQMGRDGHVYIGTADLVLEFEDTLHLYDYKSYPGNPGEITNPQSSHYAGSYSGQLDAYAVILEAAFGKKVSKKFICYTVLGKIVELS